MFTSFHNLLQGIGILGIGVIICFPKSAQSLELPIHTGLGIQGYIKKSAIWSNKNISVCWQTSSQDFKTFSTEREWVRNEIANTWEYQSLVRFVGWELCDNQPKNIRISISDERPHTKALGNELDNVPDGMMLNFNFNSWSPVCQGKREYCIRLIATHEFGHALGFAHEQNRTDTPSWCKAERSNDGDTPILQWDLESVMNYCNPRWNGNGSLSNADITTVQTYYGQPPEKIASVFSVVRGNRADLFVVGNDDAVWSTGWDGTAAADQTKNWFPISNPGTAPAKSAVTSVVRGNRVDLFVVGSDGAVWSTGWNGTAAADQTKNWFPISNPGTAPAKSAVTSVVRGNRVDLFVVGSDGAVWSTGWDGTAAADQTKNWFPISNPGTAPAKSAVTSVVRGNRVDLFVVGNDGAVWSTGWDGTAAADQTKNWFPISNPGTATTTSIITGLVRRNTITLLLVGRDGAVWSTGWDGTAAADQTKRWGPVSNPGTAPNQSVVAGVVQSNHFTISVVGNDGAVWITEWDEYPAATDQKKRWTPVSNIETTGAKTTVSSLVRGNRLDLFVVGKDGAIWSTGWDGSAAADQPKRWFPISNPGTAPI